MIHYNPSHDPLYIGIAYTVHVLSGPPPNNQSYLSITLIGATSSSQPMRLQRLDSGGYLPGTADTFSIQCEDVGLLTALKVVQYYNIMLLYIIIVYRLIW